MNCGPAVLQSKPDIVERLRKPASGDLSDFPMNAWGPPLSAMLSDASAEIERLRSVITRDTHVLLSKRPVAWRVKSAKGRYGDWMLFDDEERANKFAQAHDFEIQGLYARDGK